MQKTMMGLDCGDKDADTFAVVMFKDGKIFDHIITNSADKIKAFYDKYNNLEQAATLANLMNNDGIKT